jgi:hypothetical protein
MHIGIFDDPQGVAATAAAPISRSGWGVAR